MLGMLSNYTVSVSITILQEKVFLRDVETEAD